MADLAQRQEGRGHVDPDLLAPATDADANQQVLSDHMDLPGTLRLSLPAHCDPLAGEKFSELAHQLAAGATEEDLETALTGWDSVGRPYVHAALHVLMDLVAQGWSIAPGPVIRASPAEPTGLRDIDKARIRKQELLKRDERLREPPVRQFVRELETRRLRGRSYVCIFNLMRDGEELSAALRHARAAGTEADLRAVIDPYIEVVREGARCATTDLLLSDIWRYFRLTWANQPTSLPGRQMAFLVRDRVAPWHPVIGIGALGSAIVQIGVRDRWIGWDVDSVVAQAKTNPTEEFEDWMLAEVQRALDEIYLDDFLDEGILDLATLVLPSADLIATLRLESAHCRSRHHRSVRTSDLKRAAQRDDPYWISQTKTDLFRSKRALALAELLQVRMVLNDELRGDSPEERVQNLLGSKSGRSTVGRIVRRAKADRVGTEIADITVCGAIAPYNDLITGKLIALLAASPEITRAYHHRYGNVPSEIASSLAGRPITRRAQLALLGTTSLYGSGSSQYNRIRMPASVVRGRPEDNIRYVEVGKSQAYGTSQFREKTVASLVQLAEQSGRGQRVNSIFGEGVNPKMRKVRAGLEELGWPSEDILRHGRQRSVYVIPLTRNARRYLLGIDTEPDYLFDIAHNSTAIADFWINRWLRNRINNDDVLDRVAHHNLSYPVNHGARVELPAVDEGLTLF